MPHTAKPKKSSEEEILSNNKTLDKALAANKRRLFFQNVLTSTVSKIVATVFLLSLLFSVTFLIAYQQIQKQRIVDALKEVPKAEITVPNIVEYANPSPTPALSLTPTGVQGRFCGGIAAIQCPSGQQCVLDGDYPDAGGTCAEEGAELVDKELEKAP